jgi:hypothetical protein
MRVSLGVCGYRVQAQNTFDRDGIRPPTSSTWGSLSGILRIVGDTEDAIACGSVSTQLAYNASACEDPGHSVVREHDAQSALHQGGSLSGQRMSHLHDVWDRK